MTLTFKGILTEADHKSHIPVGFDVPKGVTRLSGRFTATPERSQGTLFDNLISLSLFGPRGARGARHNNPEMDFVIDAGAATPGYVAGVIEPGRWTVFMDTFRVIGPDPVQWRLDIEFDIGPVESATRRAPYRPAPRGPGWYRGDLHAHSWHSDASWDIPDLVAWARANRLDFVTLTDHNTVSGHDEVLSLGSDDLLTMGGVELTTHHGHALSLGHRDWQEWRTGPVTGRTMPMIAEEVMAKGNLFVIAHPMSEGDPACTGCRWEYPDMMPGPAGIVEIWNGGPWSDYNEEGLALYRRWLGQGHRLMATAGSDIHGPEGYDVANGFNNVAAEDRTEAAILAAVRAGRNYLSSGPTLILSAETASGEAIPMGGEVQRTGRADVQWTIGETPLTLRFVGPKGVLQEHTLEAHASGRTVLSELPETFLMAELRDANGILHAVTNPIFVV
ncbi:CehA/McbA family metallohydrolase [Tabrizicola sp.]|uniref:CehA/McbA family metallohydrolase n=1 Tax=Tabrizicola sp. TaxID=2005166 RepID=UPI003F335149